MASGNPGNVDVGIVDDDASICRSLARVARGGHAADFPLPKNSARI